MTPYALAGGSVALTNSATRRTIALTDEQKNVLKLEHEIGQLPQVELPIRHFFIETPDGRGYAREMTIPAGVALVGRVHKHPCINIVSKGDISVTTDNGVKRVKAPYIFTSPAGTKRAGYAHEETLWTTFHVTNETDVDKIEDALGTITIEEFLEYTCPSLP